MNLMEKKISLGLWKIQFNYRKAHNMNMGADIFAFKRDLDKEKCLDFIPLT